MPVEMSDRLADDRPVRGHSDHEKPGVARYTGPLHSIEGLRLDGSFLGTHPAEARPGPRPQSGAPIKYPEVSP